jgi:hypothetical protein
MWRNLKYFTLSLALHILVLLPLLWFAIETEPNTKHEVIELEIKPNSITSGRDEGQKISKYNKDTNDKSKRKSQSDLLQKIFAKSFVQGDIAANSGKSNRQREGSWEESTFSLDDDPNVAWGAGGGTFDRIQDLALMSRFHEKVNNLLFYPGVLARHKIKGIVNTRVVLNNEGDCDWQLTKINSNDAHLRFFILHLIKKTCDENYKKYLGARTSTNIDMSFEFSISEQPTTQELISQNQKVLGNVLFFFRNSQQSVAEWHLGPFTGVFPIPWVNLDFGWLEENFDHYVNNKEQMNEYREVPL